MNTVHGDAVVRAVLTIALLTANACSNRRAPAPSHATRLTCDETTNPTSATGYALQPFCAPQDPGPGSIWFAASGEVLALTGYAFPPASDAAAAFVDGWDVIRSGTACCTIHPAHFDQFAARAATTDDGTAARVTLEETIGVDYTAYTDAQRNVLEWRYCVEPPTDVHPKLIGTMRFDPHGVPGAVSDDPRTGLRDYYDFATYDQSTQGHLNSDGLCYVRRNYPSPN